MDYELLTSTGMKKYELCKTDSKRFFVKAVVAGFYLGVAIILSYTLGSMLYEASHVAAKIAYAGTFGLALVLIYLLGGELFTGNIFITALLVYDKKLKIKQVIPMWVSCFIGNFVGIALISFLFIKSGVHFDNLHHFVGSIISDKLSVDNGQVLLRAILCNFVVCVGGYAGYKVKDETAKTIVIFFVVMTFVIAGFEHSIANMGIFTMGATLGTPIDWIALAVHMVISTIGNIIGGGILLALPIYYMIKPDKK